ncbi:protein-export membrane protein [Halobacteriovorax marinus SJ]|uniref:Protein-export membrane protein SecF n=1 Tax=Halobacteriovorax marinus (strain ATCC BAA-682 / DSM 15412 / SJ) TaxID=862908 RepID=E1X0T7_HALMS|nr:protein translocase subunit SecF [Halobacteriovorax marinus]CBW26425.1 protein-export membrane protein [Halobacteriovorax marinus SJ]
MFEIISNNTKINFVNKFSITTVISLLLVSVSLFGIITKMNYGVDFRGGAEIQLKFKESINLDGLRKELADAGFKGIAAQTIGERSQNEFLVKVQGDETNLNQITEKVSETLLASYASKGVEVRKVDIVGPKAGAQLRISGFQAMLWALIAIMIYIGLRFDFKYSPGAIVALFHDVTIILGVFAFFNVEFTLQTVAALLAVIGYSVNDTVIVYDRVREHEEKNSALDLASHINNAVNETLSRTIMTSLTTLFVSVVMYFFGGLAIRDFFLAISLGVLIGTYSSIFVAAPVTLFFDRVKGSQEKNTANA